MNLDAKIDNEIFRNDWPVILALNAHLATILPVRLKFKSDGYKAGQVLSRDTGTGFFAAYSAVSASFAAAAILLDAASSDQFLGTTGTSMGRGVFGGEVYQSNLTDLSSGAKTDLGGKTIIDASGVSILKF